MSPDAAIRNCSRAVYRRLDRRHDRAAPNKQIKVTGEVGAVGGTVFSYHPTGPDHYPRRRHRVSGAFTVSASTVRRRDEARLPDRRAVSTRVDVSSITSSVVAALDTGGDFLAALGMKTTARRDRLIERRLAGRWTLGGRIGRPGRSPVGMVEEPRIYFGVVTAMGVTMPVDSRMSRSIPDKIGIGLTGGAVSAMER